MKSVAIGGMPTIHCARCGRLRALRDWRERGDELVIQLEPCGHLAVRNARIEWLVKVVAA